MRNVSLLWPSRSVLTELVQKSSGSFIVAFTLVNFVKDGSDLPHRKLEAVTLASTHSTLKCSELPHVLHTLFVPLKPS
jgi:hypothetical protein